MSEEELHSCATPSDTAQPKVYPSPILTPMEIKLSTIAGHDDDHEAGDSIVPKIDSPISSSHLSVARASKQVGIYMQTIVASDQAHTAEPLHLVSVATDFNTAHADMLAHAGEQIGKNLQWGAARHIPRSGTWDIVDGKDVVHLRYRLEAVRSTDRDKTGNPVDWVRETEWLQNHYADRPPVHHGLYLDMNCNSDKEAKEVFLGGYSCVGEANSAMKTTARAYLREHSGVRLFERSLELVGGDGQVRQRYVIKDGRWEDGGFVKEEEWIKKEVQIREGLSLPPSPTSICRAKGKFSIMPLDAQTPEPDVTQDEARVTPQPDLRSCPGQPQIADPNPEVEAPAQDAKVWCTCRRPDDGTLMLCCENDNCNIQWYHGRCVGVKKEPADDVEWFCPACVPGASGRVSKKRGAKKDKRGGRATRATSEAAAGVEKRGRKKRRIG
jgi:hypothetical protein